MKNNNSLLKFRSWIFFPLLILLCYQNTFSQSGCCNDSACARYARGLAKEFTRRAAILGRFPDDVQKQKNQVDSIRVTFPFEYKKLVALIHTLHDWSDSDISRLECMVDRVPGPPSDLKFWMSYLMGNFFPSTFRSPEFKRAIGIHFYLNQGSVNLFSHDERYVATGNGYVSYTFTKKGQATAGRLRLMLGPNFYYSAKNLSVLANPRAEIRFKDIGVDLASIGCLKVIIQGNFNDKIQMAGAGLGAELSNFALQLTGDYDFPHKDYLVQVGIGYQFLLKP